MQALYDVPAPAKLNLFLHVVGKRPDGYHLLESVFALIDWADTLHFERRTDGQLQRHDRGDALPADDLCLRAARLLQAESGCGLGADIHIEKRLPSGAGMGGGSSDAASTLLALNRLWGLRWPLSRLLPLGLKLGADVPFFLGGRNAFVQGIGEDLTPIELPEQTFAIVKPDVSIPTKDIFSSPLLQRSETLAIVAVFPEHGSKTSTEPSESNRSNVAAASQNAKNSAPRLELNAESCARIASFLEIDSKLNNALRNDLQKPAEQYSSQVTQALALLESRFGNSRMTGSGSAVFATVQGKDGMSNQPMATLPELPPGWVGKVCRSLVQHPLRGWTED
ncbi:4-(cytidine 5'-diphospho)-2-C-methyl-D-erythritol kinase [Mitsuaria sp. WAJ17]|uniref:4-(cytidine 5'-diphospho)-2-C-methyl-D-erythritol kinase n=1 Tax=Mitsuaria sp. WAJ17 TaxID=2761452 RepID=UPI0016020012|nr:4-(cytidine 5'-diphospho)-2-C-methyl-D-erythritol kinase [Mitsuaria sp. WAJ17]MBB2485052.1 4-(cytidine 5'-diphospho)-2-C-methyl-D-erythritol kinase [Mitsuaria sp. WAJ17]